MSASRSGPRIKQQNAKDKKMFSKMFGGNSSLYGDRPAASTTPPADDDVTAAASFLPRFDETAPSTSESPAPLTA